MQGTAKKEMCIRDRLVVVWTEINYLTAIKDYRNILLAFFVSLLMAFLIGILLIFVLHWDITVALLTGVCLSLIHI